MELNFRCSCLKISNTFSESLWLFTKIVIFQTVTATIMLIFCSFWIQALGMGGYFNLRRLYFSVCVFLAIIQLLITDFVVSTWNLWNFPLFHVCFLCIVIYFSAQKFKSFSKNIKYREFLGTFEKLLKIDYSFRYVCPSLRVSILPFVRPFAWQNSASAGRDLI